MNTNPSFKFRVMLRQEHKNDYKKEAEVYVYADAYDIKYGALTFYHLISVGSQREKMAVHTYPDGKWESCSLVGVDNKAVIEQTQNTLGIGQPIKQTDARQNSNNLIETELKKYLAENSAFDLDKFTEILANISPTTIREDEIQWAASALIRKNAVPVHKFLRADKMKVMDMYIKGLINRQWNGKIAPIYNIIKEQDETRMISIIDFTVWLSRNDKFS